MGETSFFAPEDPGRVGDVRFRPAYERVKKAADRERALGQLDDEEVVEALAAASREHDPLLANVLATAALNRMHRMRAALFHLGEGVVALGPRGEVQWSNPAADALLGWDRDRALGRPFEDTVLHLDAEGEPVPPDRCRLLRTVLTGEIAHADGDHFEAHGARRVCVEYTSAPILDADEAPIGVVLAMRDCGERKRAERELRVGRERYKSLFDGFPDAVISLSQDGTIIDANPAAVDLTGRPIAQTRGRLFTEFVDPRDVEATLALFQRVVAGSHERATLRILHADGRAIDIEARGVPIVVDGEVVGVHGIVRKATRSGSRAARAPGP